MTWERGDIGWSERFGYGIYVDSCAFDHSTTPHLHTQSGGWNPLHHYRKCVVLAPERDADIHRWLAAIDATPTHSGLATREQRRFFRARAVLQRMVGRDPEDADA